MTKPGLLPPAAGPVPAQQCYEKDVSPLCHHRSCEPLVAIMLPLNSHAGTWGVVAMQILVTGDRGYIGSVLVPFLRETEHVVDGLDLGLYEGFRSHSQTRRPR